MSGRPWIGVGRSVEREAERAYGHGVGRENGEDVGARRDAVGVEDGDAPGDAVERDGVVEGEVDDWSAMSEF